MLILNTMLNILIILMIGDVLVGFVMILMNLSTFMKFVCEVLMICLFRLASFNAFIAFISTFLVCLLLCHYSYPIIIIFNNFYFITN
jgi:hypothetical protein